MQVFLHVGLPKTGTTFLQRRVFPLCKDIDYVDFHSANPLTSACDMLLYADPALCQFEEVTRRVRERVRFSDKEKLLLSDERLVGDIWNNFTNFSNAVTALKAVFGEARVILVVRRQADLIESLYSTFIKLGYFDSMHRFTNRRQGEWGHFRRLVLSNPNVDVRSLDYLAMVRVYHAVFGRENVLVLPFELMRQSMDTYLSRLSEFVGCDVECVESGIGGSNPSYSGFTLALARLLNRFALTEWNGLGFIPVKKRRFALRHFYRIISSRKKASLFSRQERHEIMQLHAENNRALSEELGLRLDTLGYWDCQGG